MSADLEAAHAILLAAALLVLPVLPLHGERSHSGRSGDGFVGRYELDFVQRLENAGHFGGISEVVRR